MKDGSPDDLLDGLVAGRERAFAALYDRCGPALFRVAAAIAGSREEAEDAVQDVFVGLVRAGERLRGVRNLRAYLFASVRRAAVRRSRCVRPAALTAADVPDTAAWHDNGDVETADRLERALASLPAAQREVVALHVDGGLTFDECGEALGVSPNTAASRYRYALEKLRDALKE
jgi:RNA polymerase sigma-70 factor (ECF subfamily)